MTTLETYVVDLVPFGFPTLVYAPILEVIWD